MRPDRLSLAGILLLTASPVAAGLLGAAERLGRDMGSTGQPMTLPFQILLLMSVLTVLPSLLLLATAFLRILVVLSILRQAIGLAQTPPNQVLIAMALVLTALVMTPTWRELEREAILPYSAGQVELPAAMSRGSDILSRFMLAQTRPGDLAAFRELSGARPSDKTGFTVLLPAFVTSELTTAFQIGFMLFLPFLVIDLLVASILTALGMMMLSPTLISLPFKLLLFVMVDGWAMTFGSLVRSFASPA